MRRTLIAGVLSALLLTGCAGSGAGLPEPDASDAPEAVVYKTPA